MADDTNPLDETLRLMAEANADQRRRDEDDRAWRATVLEREPTLRDRFAMAALQGELAAETEDSCYRTSGGVKREQKLAEAAYAIADAMLKAREARRG